MYNLIRMYNQNRVKIWIIVISIIIAFTLIQSLNKAIREENINKSKNLIEQQQNEQNTKNYKNESKSMVSGGSVAETKQNQYGNLIEQFLKYCINGEPEKAYDLLSEDCKKVVYPSEELFEDLYYDGKFNSNKKYSFQSWSSSEIYIYLVKIYDNMLTTGKDNTSNYLQDYFTIVEENGNCKINIGGFLRVKNIQKTTTKDNITILIKDIYVYMDYQIYNLEISNGTDNTIKLINNNSSNTIGLKDSNGIEFNALLNENVEDDFIIEKNKKQNLQIKFSNPYQVGIGIKEMEFLGIIKNYEPYTNNTDKEIIDIKVKF